MDIKILDSWLRDYLDTNATHKDIARCLSLCGPSIEKTEEVIVQGKKDYLYNIEVTTNRVDMMSVYGIAREASVILPEFGFKAKLKEPVLETADFKGDGEYTIEFLTDYKLVSRMIGIILEVPAIGNSDQKVKDRLESAGIRSLNNVVDITNYVMTEIGHPTHAFDYDLIAPLLKVREAHKGEEIVSFDGKKHTLPGGDVIFENSEGEIVDLPGIIGTKNSVVNAKTKRILFFIETNDPVRIRRTSMTLGIRTVAATLNEKHVDPNLAEVAIKRGLYLYKKLVGAKQLSPIIDVYKSKKETKTIKLKHTFIEKLIGVSIDTDRVLSILTKLGITTTFNKKTLDYTCQTPTFRANDIAIPEDIVEEIARIYGYHNLPSQLMTGEIPEPISPYDFKTENTIKHFLKETGANEIYTYSLSSKGELKLKNPLGEDFSYLRTTLFDSLMGAVAENKRETEKYHLFEMAHVYLPRKNDLPEERLILAGVFARFDYRIAKGIVESLLSYLGITYSFDLKNSSRTELRVNPVKGKFMVLKNDLIYYEFEVAELLRHKKNSRYYTQIPEHPPQIEDMTVKIKEGTYVCEVIEKIKKVSTLINKIELTDIYETNYTFRIWYQDPTKNLTDKEVEEVRKEILSKI